ncbi:3600_t:CDS:1, partial [Racocetra persica]
CIVKFVKLIEAQIPRGLGEEEAQKLAEHNKKKVAFSQTVDSKW